MPHSAQIAIIEYRNLMRRGLTDLLSDNPAMHVAAVAEDPVELDREAMRFDVLVFGPSPVAEKAIGEAVDPLTAHGRVLLLADFPDGQGMAEVLRAGAYGVVSRLADDEELLFAIAAVARGGLYLSPQLASSALRELRRSAALPSPALAPREAEALRWLATGLTHGQVARRMALSEATVSTYVKRIKNKFNLGNKADLTRKAIELGLLGEIEAEPGTPPHRG